MDGSLRDGDPVKNGKGPGFHPFGKAASADQGRDLGVVASMDVGVVMTVTVGMMMSLMVMLVVMTGISLLLTLVTIDQKTPSGDATPFPAFKAATG